jgi:hypothetical protein
MYDYHEEELLQRFLSSVVLLQEEVSMAQQNTFV